MLSSHPRITLYREGLVKFYDLPLEEQLAGMRERLRTVKGHIKGFNVDIFRDREKGTIFSTPNGRQAFREVAREFNPKVILLSRRNVVKQAISWFSVPDREDIDPKCDPWNTKVGSPDTCLGENNFDPSQVSARKLEATAKAMQKKHEATLEMATSLGLSALIVYYEDLQMDQEW
eukprot:CAMPEP_0174275618 /NCGR_PEP_ID=MMETSP0439-20130205/59927_1 /TAXON_ID=0 /ORGANISM="Stereomyxa ramosa, Strain Chinc5" /LENGTH=174 /DNA_ID=CAMNT_0015367745 /DNA_START=303 /DNA_END=824 /DNA_ORIENTATION=-